MSELYLGMISGTSVDGIDAAIVDFGDRTCHVVAARTFPYPPTLKSRLEWLISKPVTSLRELGALDIACGRCFADAALDLIRTAGIERAEIAAIGHHGQTVFHEPDGPEPFTMQLGDASTVSAITGIATVADIRALDMALGGQGAPMVPAFHAWRFADPAETRVIANIGGIGNITTLASGQPVIGFDTGPGNTLMDLWIQRCRDTAYDRDGGWAATGRVLPVLLEQMLAEPYFARSAPKSTGRELFNADWLDRHLAAFDSDPAPGDVQATLAELTAVSLTTAVTELKLNGSRLIVCGGGAHNGHLLARIEALHDGNVTTTAALGLDPDWVEAVAFAWLARARLRHEPGNVATVTGARKDAVLGGLYSQDTR